MADYDFTKQRIVPLSGTKAEYHNGVTIAGVDGQVFTIACKLYKVIGGFGIMLKDGMVAKPTIGLVSSGQIEMTRIGPISKADGTTGTDPTNICVDTCTAVLFGH